MGRLIPITMVDPLSTDDASEDQGSKNNFVGRVVRSEIDTDDEKFQTDFESDWDIVYEIEPVTEYDKNMYELGLNTASSLYSKWMVFVAALENVHGPLEEQGVSSIEDLPEFLEGKVYEFKDVEFLQGKKFNFEQQDKIIDLGDIGGDNTPNPMMLPEREVDSEELADLGEDVADEEVEEVNLGE